MLSDAGMLILSMFSGAISGMITAMIWLYFNGNLGLNNELIKK